MGEGGGVSSVAVAQDASTNILHFNRAPPCLLPAGGRGSGQEGAAVAASPSLPPETLRPFSQNQDQPGPRLTWNRSRREKQLQLHFTHLWIFSITVFFFSPRNLFLSCALSAVVKGGAEVERHFGFYRRLRHLPRNLSPAISLLATTASHPTRHRQGGVASSSHRSTT